MRDRIAGLLVGLVMMLCPVPARAGRHPIAIGDPAQPLILDPRLVVDVRAASPADGEERRSSTSEWRATGQALVRDMTGDGWTAVLRATPDRRGLTLEVEIQYSAAVVVNRESIRFSLPGAARALGRDLRVAPLERTLRIDRGTPVWLATAPTARAPGAALVAEQGIPAARFSPRGDRTDVELVLDDTASHPFLAFASCRSSYLPHEPGLPAPRRPDPELERRVRRDHIGRAAGDVVRARMQLYLVRPGAEFLPLIVERWAYGAHAAVVFTDHADRTDPEALRAVLYGVSDRHLPGRPPGGFFGHGVKITKTFFLSPGLGSLEDPEARELASEITARGSEVGSHSITPDRDQRSLVESAIPSFSPWGVVTWIDHQPDTNCEAIASRGWRDDPTYGIHDVLAAAGFRWVWGASDVPGRAQRIGNVFEPERPGASVPPIYPLPSDPRLWVFESSWFYDRSARMAAALSDAELDRLEAERGLFVAHTYLSASPRTTRRRDLIERDVVQPLPEGGLAIDPVFDEALARLGGRVARGRIASLTVRDSGERLRALGAVAIRYRSDGAAVVVNQGPVPLPGLTLAIPADVDVDVDGARQGGTAREPGRTAVWFDLPAGGQVVISARAFSPVEGPQGASAPTGAGELVDRRIALGVAPGAAP